MKLNHFLALVFVSSLSFHASASCPETKAQAAASSDLARAVAAAKGEGVVSVQVPKMSCKSCAMKIKKTLKTEHALQDVDVNVEAKTVSFSCPQTNCSVDQVLSTLSGIGYTATVL